MSEHLDGELKARAEAAEEKLERARDALEQSLARIPSPAPPHGYESGKEQGLLEALALLTDPTEEPAA